MTTINHDLRANLVASCDQLLRAAMKSARLYFESHDLPLRDVEISVMEPGEPGHWSGTEFTEHEVDTERLSEFLSTTFISYQEWSSARDAVQAYVDEYEILPIGFWGPFVAGQYLAPLLVDYVRRTERFVYRKLGAEKIIQDLLDHLDSTAPNVTGLFILEGFSAERPFKLEPTMEIRPISHKELVELGRPNEIFGQGVRQPADRPRTDWWVCEVTLPNPRATFEGFNRLNDIQDLVAFALRAFKSGGLNIGKGFARILGPFGNAGTTRGGRLDRISMASVNIS